MIPRTSLDVLDKFAVIIFSVDQDSKYLMKVGGKDIKSITDTQILPNLRTWLKNTCYKVITNFRWDVTMRECERYNMKIIIVSFVVCWNFKSFRSDINLKVKVVDIIGIASSPFHFPWLRVDICNKQMKILKMIYCTW